MRPTKEAVNRVLADLERLHSIKQHAYGASWCKHGEYLSIFANITRKADRLFAGTSTPDESSLDTLADLAVYCTLYRSWLDGNSTTPDEGMALTLPALAIHVDSIEPSCIESALRMAQETYEQLERVLLENLQADRPLRTIKRSWSLLIAAYCVYMLALRTETSEYAAWAVQWAESEEVHATTA